MKKLVYFLSLLFFFFTPQISAHDESQPPFVFVNSKSTLHSSIRSTSLTDFFIAHDVMPERYLINTPVIFTMQPEKLQYNSAIYLQTSYIWNFGDGTTSTSLNPKHSYKKIGSYIVTIDAIHKNNPSQQIFAGFIHIVPNSDYQLPTPTIDSSSSDFSTAITLDGTTPKAVYYYWDLGDQTTSDKPKVTHSYATNHSNIHPILRVKDANGFIVDSQITITNTPQSSTTRLTLINQIFAPLRKLINKVFLH